MRLTSSNVNITNQKLGNVADLCRDDPVWEKAAKELKPDNRSLSKETLKKIYDVASRSSEYRSVHSENLAKKPLLRFVQWLLGDELTKVMKVIYVAADKLIVAQCAINPEIYKVNGNSNSKIDVKKMAAEAVQIQKDIYVAIEDEHKVGFFRKFMTKLCVNWYINATCKSYKIPEAIRKGDVKGSNNISTPADPSIRFRGKEGMCSGSLCSQDSKVLSCEYSDIEGISGSIVEAETSSDDIELVLPVEAEISSDDIELALPEGAEVLSSCSM